MQKENKNQRQGKIKVVAYSVIAKNQNRASNDYERQKLYYTEKIKANPEWEIVGVFIDDKTAENEAKKRVEFNKMLALCRRKNWKIRIRKKNRNGTDHYYEDYIEVKKP